jgi:hypothetical protein
MVRVHPPGREGVGPFAPQEAPSPANRKAERTLTVRICHAARFRVKQLLATGSVAGRRIDRPLAHSLLTSARASAATSSEPRMGQRAVVSPARRLAHRASSGLSGPTDPSVDLRARTLAGQCSPSRQEALRGPRDRVSARRTSSARRRCQRTTSRCDASRRWSDFGASSCEGIEKEAPAPDTRAIR